MGGKGGTRTGAKKTPPKKGPAKKGPAGPAKNGAPKNVGQGQVIVNKKQFMYHGCIVVVEKSKPCQLQYPNTQKGSY